MKEMPYRKLALLMLSSLKTTPKLNLYAHCENCF